MTARTLIAALLLGLALAGAAAAERLAAGVDLRGKDLSGRNLDGASLAGANLTGANLAGTSLKGADLRDAILRDVVATGADLLSRKMQLEIELQVKSEILTERSDLLQRMRSELAEVERRLEELPALNIEFARLVRDLKVHEEVHRFLRAEYEQAKIREQEDTPTLTIVDEARPPILRSRPRRITPFGRSRPAHRSIARFG